MKTLPESPNLGHLRQQAKELLAQLRITDPTTTLSRAQSALAEQYGFERWTALKAEVDRRRAGATTAPVEVGERVAAAFGLGPVSGPMAPIERGVQGRVWSLRTEKGHWAAKQLFTAPRPEALDDEVRLRNVAAEAGVTSPAPVRSQSGLIAEDLGGEWWRVHEWLALGSTPTKPVKRSVASGVGDLLARLHGLNLQVDTPVTPWLTRRPSPEDWERLLEAAVSAREPWAEALRTALPDLIAVTAPAGTSPDQAILCHSDLGPANVAAGRDGVLTVLDWERTGAQPAEWELGYVLHAWCVQHGRVDRSAARALAGAYGTKAVDLSTFSGCISAMANWTMSRGVIALKSPGTEDAARAVAELGDLLAHPLTVPLLEELAHAASGSGRQAVGG